MRPLGFVMIVLYSSPLHAQNIQFTTPRERVDTPESDVGCPVPTLEECQAEGYLEEDPCGILQSQNTWTCWQLLDQALEGDQSQEEVGVIAYEIDELGVNRDVIAYAEDPLSSQEPEYVADPFSFSSQVARANYGLAGDFGIDIYAAWRANGTALLSCEEYIHEKYFDQTEFERLVGVAQHDYRRVFEIAYGPGFEESAIGSRHINDVQLRGLDGDPYRQMFSGFPRPKNEFFRVILENTIPGNSRVAGAPGLLDSIRDYNAQGQLIYNAVVFDYEDLLETWAWHREMSETLSVEGKKELGLTFRPPADGDPSDPLQTLQLVTIPEDAEDTGANEVIAQWTGTVPEEQSGGKFLRRYLDAELNEFYDMQRRMLRLFREWYRTDRRFEGSGWTVDRIAEEEPGSISSFAQVSREVPPFPGGGPLPPQFQAEGDEPGTTLPQGVFVFTGFNIEASEDIVRRRILEDILELYQRAQAAGCLERGLTPCDWSPKLFARTVLHRFNDLREADYDRCNEYVPGGDLNRVLNLDVRFIDEPEDRCPEVAAEFNCRVQTGASITRWGFERLLEEVDFCLSRIPEYLEAKAECEEQIALEAARERIFAISELVDPDSGTVRTPGRIDGGSEDKGNKWFGLNYTWQYGFGSELVGDECDLELYAGGLFNLTARAVGEELPVVNALAEVSSEDRRADISFEVLGIPLFPAIDLDFNVDATIEFNAIESVGDDRDLVSGSSRFFVGPIPVRIRAGVSGGGGVQLRFDVEASGFGQSGNSPDSCPSGEMLAGVEPYLQVSGFVEAGIDVVVAAVGVRGELTLIRAAVPFEADLIVGVDNNNPFDLAFPQNLSLSVGTRLGLDINTLSGFFSVFGRIGFCPFCKKASKTLLQWDGLAIERTIFDQDYEVYLGDLVVARQN